jgi:hypothetical protein
MVVPGGGIVPVPVVIGAVAVVVEFPFIVL